MFNTETLEKTIQLVFLKSALPKQARQTKVHVKTIHCEKCSHSSSKGRTCFSWRGKKKQCKWILVNCALLFIILIGGLSLACTYFLQLISSDWELTAPLYLGRLDECASQTFRNFSELFLWNKFQLPHYFVLSFLF